MKPSILCVIPRDCDDAFCSVVSSYLAQLIEVATDLELDILALPPEYADPRETIIDAAYAQMIESEHERGPFLTEAVSVTVNAGAEGVGVLLAGVGRKIRDHQCRGLIDLNEPLEGAADLVMGAVHSRIVPPSHLDQIKLLNADHTKMVFDFALRLAACYADNGSLESARKCWRKMLELTHNESFAASYSLASSYVATEPLPASSYLDIAERTATDNRERAFVQFQRGMLALTGQSDARAQSCFEACLHLLPACGMAYVGLAHARARAGDRVGALSALKQFLSLSRDEAAELGDATTQAEALLSELGT